MKRALRKSAKTPTPQTTTPGSATPDKARAPLALVEHAPAEPAQKSAMEKLGEALSKPPGSSWDDEPDPAVRLRKHVYQQLMNLESMLMLHPDDEDAELLRIIKKPIEILRTRLSSTPVRARAAILHSLDRGAQTIPEFVTETRLTRADILKHLDEMIADKVIEKVPDGRTSNKQGPTLYIYIRFGAPTGDNYVAPVRGSSSTARLTSAFDD
ncbi:MAG TPA: hypothetical protein VGB76_06800 [Pyrinomonadaceae bacterium]